MVEPEQGVAGRGEEIVVDARDEGMALGMGVWEESWVEGMDTWCTGQSSSSIEVNPYEAWPLLVWLVMSDVKAE